jgi:hypothetical protein
MWQVKKTKNIIKKHKFWFFDFTVVLICKLYWDLMVENSGEHSFKSKLSLNFHFLPCSNGETLNFLHLWRNVAFMRKAEKFCIFEYWFQVFTFGFIHKWDFRQSFDIKWWFCYQPVYFQEQNNFGFHRSGMAERFDLTQSKFVFICTLRISNFKILGMQFCPWFPK